MKEIQLTQGQVALIDDEDFYRCLLYTWVAKKRNNDDGWYVVAWKKGSVGNIYLHKYVMRTDKEVDHIDGNGLNCQKSNLRIVTRSQNMQNARPYRGGSSPYKGVSKRANGRFQVNIRVDGKLIYLGTFADEIEAAKRYDKAAIELFGEYARPNFTEGGDANDSNS